MPAQPANADSTGDFGRGELRATRAWLACRQHREGAALQGSQEGLSRHTRACTGVCNVPGSQCPAASPTTPHLPHVCRLQFMVARTDQHVCKAAAAAAAAPGLVGPSGAEVGEGLNWSVGHQGAYERLPVARQGQAEGRLDDQSCPRGPVCVRDVQVGVQPGSAVPKCVACNAHGQGRRSGKESHNLPAQRSVTGTLPWSPWAGKRCNRWGSDRFSSS